MMIDVLSQGTIMVSLSAEDMLRYRLDLSSPDEGSIRAGLVRLLDRVGEDCGLDRRSKSFLVEALPGGDECLLLISVRSAKKRRVFRIKREKLVDCCCFDSADDMLDFLHKNVDAGCRIYSFEGGYRLIPELPPTDRLAAELSEYGRTVKLSAVDAARIVEAGRLIFERSPKRPRPSIQKKAIQ